MRALILTQTAAPAQRLDMAALVPERLQDLKPDQVRRLPLWVGRRQAMLGDLFRVTGETGGDLVIRPLNAGLDRVGSGARHGGIRVEGSVGFHAGEGLDGAELVVEGDAGASAGAGMRAGLLHIHGDSGDRLGGVRAGATHGMSGGVLRVDGNTGTRAGERMRRGLILVAGDAGDFTAAGMIAGTLGVAGTCGRMTGTGMRRGTVLLSRIPGELPPGFNFNGPQELGFLQLLRDRLGQAGIALPDGFPRRGNRVERYVGDLAEDGRGELLAWSD